MDPTRVDEHRRQAQALRRDAARGQERRPTGLLRHPGRARQPIHFPVPWADDETLSFLATAADTRAMVEAAGFGLRVWEDVSAEATDFFTRLGEGPPTPSPLGLHLLISNMAAKGADLRRNVEEDRIAVVRAVAKTASA